MSTSRRDFLVGLGTGLLGLAAAMERRAARLAIAMQIVALAVGSVGSAVFGRSWEVDRVAAEASALAVTVTMASVFSVVSVLVWAIAVLANEASAI